MIRDPRIEEEGVQKLATAEQRLQHLRDILHAREQHIIQQATAAKAIEMRCQDEALKLMERNKAGTPISTYASRGDGHVTRSKSEVERYIKNLKSFMIKVHAEYKKLMGLLQVIFTL